MPPSPLHASHERNGSVPLIREGGSRATQDHARVTGKERESARKTGASSASPRGDVGHLAPRWRSRGNDRIFTKGREWNSRTGETEWPRHKRGRPYRVSRSEYAYYDYDQAGLDQMHPRRSFLQEEEAHVTEDLYGEPEDKRCPVEKPDPDALEQAESASKQPLAATPTTTDKDEKTSVPSLEKMSKEMISMDVTQDTSAREEPGKSPIPRSLESETLQPAERPDDVSRISESESSRPPTMLEPIVDAEPMDMSVVSDICRKSDTSHAMDVTPCDETEEMQRAIQALVNQLLIKYPWSEKESHAVLEQNHRIVASLRVPAALGLQKCAEQEPGVATGEIDAYLKQRIHECQQSQEAKLTRLRNEYRAKHQAWVKYCERLDQEHEQRAMHQDDPALSASALPSTSTTSSSATTRSFRRGGIGSGSFGDAVRSEAEFQEILASLENAEMQDPVVRAARTSAVIPDMELKGTPFFDGDNGHVADPVSFYFGGFDPDVWSEEERATFARRYVLYPKQFGRIAEKLPHKTPNQCVAFYYLHKHLEGYKALLSARHRERRKKTKSRPKKSKGSALMADIAATQLDAEDEEKRSATGSTNPVSTAVPAPAPTSKRRSDEAAPKSKKPRAASKSRRDAPLETDKSSVGVGAETELERDLAAAEALEALASLAAPVAAPAPAPMPESAAVMPSSSTPAPAQASAPVSDPSAAQAATASPPTASTLAPEPKKRRPSRVKDSDEPKSRSRGPHWSMSERAEFLRLLAIYGKDWNALAASFPAKTPAQTRNFFARHASESSHFQEAAGLAQKHAHMSWEDKAHAAAAFVRHWYDSLPEGSAKASILGWPSPGMKPPSPPPREMSAVIDDETDDEDQFSAGNERPGHAHPIPPPGMLYSNATVSPPPNMLATSTRSHPQQHAHAHIQVPLPHAQTPQTAFSGASQPQQVPPPLGAETHWSPVAQPMMGFSYPNYSAPPRPTHTPSPATSMYYREPNAAPYGAAPMPPPMSMYNYPMPPKYAPHDSMYAPSPASRLPMRSAPNMGYFHPRPDRWHG